MYPIFIVCIHFYSGARLWRTILKGSLQFHCFFSFFSSFIQSHIFNYPQMAAISPFSIVCDLNLKGNFANTLFKAAQAKMIKMALI